MSSHVPLVSIVADAQTNAPPPAGGSSKLDTGTWIALVLAALATAYIMSRAKKRRDDPLERSTITPSLSQQRQVERQMSNLLVELSEMSREISAGLDTRAARLEALLDEADRKIAALESLSNGTVRTAPAAPSSNAFAPPDSQSMLPPQVRESGEAPQHAMVTRARSEQDALLREVETSSASPAVEISMSDTDARHAQIYSLADQGRSPHEIAATLSRPSGEVELILALRPGRG